MKQQDLHLKSDMELVEETKTGMKRSYSELVKRHQKGLLRLSMRFVKRVDVAEDVVQDAFIKAYEKLHSFEARSSFKSWLYQIAVNTARNKLRENRGGAVDIDRVHIAVGPVAEADLIQFSVAEYLQREIEKLPFRQRTALVLRVYEDLSFKEIAEVMECPYDTAKANYRHALLKLREAIEQKTDYKSHSFDSSHLWLELNHFAEAEG
jgi:RNA polymerase sigma-70 factor (ECF subfamily)